MGEPAMKMDVQTNEPMAKKKVQISGLTENWRLKDLELCKEKLGKKGWIFEEYIDDGMTKSYAIFKRPLSIKDPIHPAIKVAGGMLLLLALVGLLNSQPKSDNTQKEASQDSTNEKVSVENQSKSNNVQAKIEERERFILEANKKLNELMISKEHPVAKKKIEPQLFHFYHRDESFFLCMFEGNSCGIFQAKGESESTVNLFWVNGNGLRS